MTFVNTYSGKKVFFNEVKPEDLDIGSIAKSLSRMCRYTGHTQKFYSVAQHCVLAAKLTYSYYGYKPELAMAALLHEAPEAYGMGDIHGTFKRSLGQEARKIIKGYEAKIFAALGYPEGMPEEVDYVDSMLLVDEMRQLFKTDKTAYVDFKDNIKYKDCKGFGIEINPLGMEEAEKEFLNMYFFLMERMDSNDKNICYL